MINTLDQPLLFTEHSEHTLVDNQHSITSWSTVCQESTKFWLTHISQLTLGWLSTNCWSGLIKSWRSIIWDVDQVLRFWSRVCTLLRMPLAHDPIASRPLSKQTFLQHSTWVKSKFSYSQWSLQWQHCRKSSFQKHSWMSWIAFQKQCKVWDFLHVCRSHCQCFNYWQ